MASKTISVSKYVDIDVDIDLDDFDDDDLIEHLQGRGFNDLPGDLIISAKLC